MAAIKTEQDLIAALREAEIPQRAIATKLNLAPSAVSNIFSGTRGIKFEEAIALISMLPERAAGHELPLIGMAGAGAWLEAVEVTRRNIFVPAGLRGEFAVEVVGDSMDLVLPDGSIAVIDPSDTSLFVGKLYLLLNAEGEGTIKRYRTDPARFEPVSSDPFHKPFEIGSIDIKVIGRVTGSVQMF